MTDELRIGDAERGKRLFAARGCVGCHAVAGEFAGGQDAQVQARRGFRVEADRLDDLVADGVHRAER